MIRNLKALGLALVAVFALSAVAASAASAQQGKLTSTGSVTLDATEIGAKNSGANALTALGGSVECHGSTITGHNVLTTQETAEGKVHGLIQVPATTVTLTPDYEQKECRAHLPILGEREATVNMHGCDYVLHIGETIGTTGTFSATADIVCPTGEKIDLEIYKTGAAHEAGNVICTVKVGSQSGLAGEAGKPVVVKNAGGTPDDIVVEGTLVGITLEHTGSVCGTATENNAKFDINVTVKGTTELGEETGVTVTD